MKKFYKKKKIELYIYFFFVLLPFFILKDINFINEIREKNMLAKEIVKELDKERNMKFFLLVLVLTLELFTYKKIKSYLGKLSESRSRLKNVRGMLKYQRELNTTNDYYIFIKYIEKYIIYLNNMKKYYQEENEGFEEKIDYLKNTLIEIIVNNEHQYKYFTDMREKFNLLMENILLNNKRVNKLRFISKNTKKSINYIIDESKDLKKLIDKLFDSAKEVEKITELIEKLSFQTTILALNSSVESVRGGSEKSSFDIISTEIHHLSTNSKKAAIRVREISMSNSMKVIKMEETLDTTVQFIEKITKKIDNIMFLTNNIKEVFDGEMENIKELERLIKIIEELVKESTNKSKEIHLKSNELFDEVRRSVNRCKVDFI